MKRLLALLLVCIMAISIVACGPADDAKDPVQSSDDQQTNNDAQSSDDQTSDTEPVTYAREDTPDSLPSELKLLAEITFYILPRCGWICPRPGLCGTGW